MKKYTNDDHTVYYGKHIIGKMYIKANGNHELRIAQGMPRQEVIDKIISDCPEFCKNNNITDNTRPLFY